MGIITEVSSFPVDHDSGTQVLTVPNGGQAVGDIAIFEVMNINNFHLTALSGGGVALWQQADSYFSAGIGRNYDLWWGVVTATGGGAVTPTWSSVPTSYFWTVDCWHDSVAGGTWALTVAGHSDNASSTTVNFPSLTSGSSGDQLYSGIADCGNAVSAGSTPGFTYRAVTWGANEEGAVNLALATTTGYAPTCTQSPASLSVTSALILTYTVAAVPAAIPANIAGPNGAFF